MSSRFQSRPHLPQATSAPNNGFEQQVLLELSRIADALEQLQQPVPPSLAPSSAPSSAQSSAPVCPNWQEACLWEARPALQPLPARSYLPAKLILECEQQQQSLSRNLLQFACGRPANNVLLWGARGSGKSALILATIAEMLPKYEQLRCIELPRDHLTVLPTVLLAIRSSPKYRFIIYCDDLSFESGDNEYKILKSMLDGGLSSRLPNLLLLATSNRRHLVARESIENEREQAIHPNEVVDEKVALSDRFGLWLGMHVINQSQYLKIVANYLQWAQAPAAIMQDNWQHQALIWAKQRSSFSGRVAWQFFIDFCSSRAITIPELPVIKQQSSKPDR